MSKTLIEKTKKINFVNLVIYTVLILISYQFMYPLLRMVSMSMMSSDDIINPVVNWIPQSWSFGNFRLAWRVLNPSNTMVNSIWFSGLLSIGQTIIAATTGFALARFDFPFKRFWFVMILISFILPASVVLIPRTMVAMTLQDSFGIQMMGTIWPQTLMAFSGQGIFSAILILIFYNFTRMIPPALDEAAAIDGASAMQTFYHVILKLSVTTLLVVFLFAFVWNWNETQITTTFLRGGLDLVPTRLSAFESLFDSMANLGPGAAQAVAGGAEMGLEQQRLNEAFRMSGTLIAIVPLFVLYLLVQRQFIKGIENTGLTGI